MINQRTLIHHVHAVMAPGNPVPRTACQSEEAGVPRVSELLAFDEAEPQPASVGIRSGGGRERAARGGVTWRVLAPALSGAAVIAVVAGLALANVTSAHPGPGGASSASAGVPAMYLTINGRPGHSGAIVHNSLTGATIASFKEPYLKGTVPVVTAVQHGAQEQFLILRWIEVSGKPTAQTQAVAISHGKLRVLTIDALTGFGPQVKIEGIARCRAGFVMALGVPRQGGGFTPQIRLVAAQLRTWAAPGTAAIPSDLSCVGTDRVSFVLTDGRTARGQVRELDRTAPGHSLLASRVVARSGGKQGTILTAFASPRGGPIVATTFGKSGRGHDSRLRVVRLVAISPRTGKVIKVFETIFEVHRGGGTGVLAAKRSCQVLSLDSTGHHALVNCGGLHRLDNGKFSNLPGQSGKFGSLIVAAAW